MSTQQPRPPVAGFSLYRGLERSIYILFVIRIINRFGDFVQMLLVLILTGKLMLSSSQAGLFVSSSIVLTMLGQLTSGFLSDRFGSKRLLVFYQSMISFSYLLCAMLYVSHPHFVPYLILLASPFRGGTSPLTNTMVADFSKSEQLSRSFSLLYLGTNIGVAVGPVAASFLYARSLVLLFSFSSLLLCLSTILLGLSIKMVQTRPVERNEEPSPQVSKARPQTVLLVFYAFFSLYSLVYGQNTFTLPLQFSFLFGEQTGTGRYAVLMMVNAVTVLVATTTLTAWTYRLGQLSSMALAMFFFVLGYGMYAWCDAFPLFLAATCIWTFGEILMATNANVFVNAYAPRATRSRSNAYVTTASSLGHAISPTFGGLLLLVVSYRQLWLINAGICIVLGCGYIALHTYLRK
ncbi:MFS transporter [Sphaerochaeta sp.]|uniref:MFS transporter n=1 Tax=Sphaerochaeta sp. TaxID=1972642 RepID=UPI002FC7C648